VSELLHSRQESKVAAMREFVRLKRTRRTPRGRGREKFPSENLLVTDSCQAHIRNKDFLRLQEVFVFCLAGIEQGKGSGKTGFSRSGSIETAGFQRAKRVRSSCQAHNEIPTISIKSHAFFVLDFLFKRCLNIDS
jgi:hypothetical protein